MEWADGTLINAKIEGKPGVTGTYLYKGKSTDFEIPAKGIINVDL